MSYEKSFQIAKLLDDSPGRCNVLKQLGILEEISGNLSGAQECYSQMFTVASQAGIGTLPANLRMEASKFFMYKVKISLKNTGYGKLDVSAKWLITARPK
jgi:hypothetical protein